MSLPEPYWQDNPLPSGPFGAILADPPWLYADGQAGSGLRGAASSHYDVISVQHLCALPVGEVAATDSALFLWTCLPLLPEALEVIEAWGFRYKTAVFSWTKVTLNGRAMFGCGNWTGSNVELVLLGTRGHPKRLNADVPQAIIERRREHSRKPDCVHERIQRLVAGPYLELFARSARPGWTAWGNETEKFDPMPDLERQLETGAPNLFSLEATDA